jgi:hypothetical protein
MSDSVSLKTGNTTAVVNGPGVLLPDGASMSPTGRVVPGHLREYITPPNLVPDGRLSVSKFVRTLVGTDKEVYSKLLVMRHKGQAMTLSEWHAHIDKYGSQPAHSNKVL